MAAPMRASAPGFELRALDAGWELAPGDGGSHPPKTGWSPARVPGTVAGAHRDAGNPVPDDLDDRDWWFRTTFDAAPAEPGEEVLLRLDGIATIADVLLDGRPLATITSMFLGQTIDVGTSMGGSHVLAIRCQALTPVLALPRRPRARWRTALVDDGNVRWIRTSLIGRAPGYWPGPVVVGPWRAISLERRHGIAVDDLRVRATLDGTDGRVSVDGRVRGLGGILPERTRVEVDGPTGRQAMPLDLVEADGAFSLRGDLRIPDVARWWPHTHGRPDRYSVRIVVESEAGELTVDGGKIGFRTVAPGPTAEHHLGRDGLDLHVNGTPVFVRGAVWTPIDPVGFGETPDDVRRSLEQVRAAGMNMLRVPGIGTYESPAFHELCDELGILVWQDLMFANLDYPFADDAFRASAEREAGQLVGRIAGRPSTAVVCGNSEVEQQVAMLGLDPSLGRDDFFAMTLPGIVVAARSDAVVVPSAPSGGDLPFRPDHGIANYYGVGGYRRPLSDARAAGVRFAAECLAFSNVPDQPHAALGDPAWDTGIPRDNGATWDFEDVRDHYLGELYDVDPAALRRDDPARYLELSQSITGEVMAEVFGEWRRPASTCNGGLVLWWRDVVPGAGWGIVDRDGRPKAAYHHLRRALRPVAVWMTDEGLGGIDVHVANDRAEPVIARLSVTLYRDGQTPVGDAAITLDLPPHSSATRNIEALLNRFVDVSWAYRFGPPAQDLAVARLDAIDGDQARPLSQAVRFPIGRPSAVEDAQQLGLAARVATVMDGVVNVDIGTRRFAHGVRIDAPGFVADDDAFSIEPGGTRRIELRPTVAGTPFRDGRLTALNLAGHIVIEP